MGIESLNKKPFVKSSGSKYGNVLRAKTEDNPLDIQIWLRFKAGDESAFAKIYRNNVSFLYSYGLKLVYNKPMVWDCIQDLFVYIWDRKDKLGEVNNIRLYLCKSLRRKILNENKKDLMFIGESFINHSDEKIISESVEYKLIEKQKFDQQLSKVKLYLNNLTIKQREVIHLKFYVGLSYPEIAEIMDLSTKATYKLMGRAISMLRHFYK
ncbi:RNA polymerase sigma factor [Aestuariivivens sp. NBU2969]|uniref:RNA polymerase sigma factor n=1 Tax=Aestuariivivens sp. NBU2969 TaxID=2873267 RepID=UPI001CBF49B4|nr:sigma-70 family RNA polymerase sigma factor [Aestuariivivens sp. NBU2969]